jgi:prephenate dehydrogenase
METISSHSVYYFAYTMMLIADGQPNVNKVINMATGSFRISKSDNIITKIKPINGIIINFVRLS